MPCEPSLHGWLSMCVQIVKNHMYDKLLRNTLVYRTKEDEKFLMPVLLMELCDDRPIEYVERSEQVYLAIPFVIVRPASWHPRTEGEDGLASVESLYAILLVHAYYNRLIWRVHVQTNYVPDLLVELRVSAQLDLPLSMGLYVVRLPYLMDGEVAHTHLACERARAPVSCSWRFCAESVLDDLINQLLRNPGLPARSGRVLAHTIQTMGYETIPPEGHRLRTHAELLYNLRVL